MSVKTGKWDRARCGICQQLARDHTIRNRIRVHVVTGRVSMWKIYPIHGFKFIG